MIDYDFCFSGRFIVFPKADGKMNGVIRYRIVKLHLDNNLDKGVMCQFFGIFFTH